MPKSLAQFHFKGDKSGKIRRHPVTIASFASGGASDDLQLVTRTVRCIIAAMYPAIRPSLQNSHGFKFPCLSVASKLLCFKSIRIFWPKSAIYETLPVLIWFVLLNKFASLGRTTLPWPNVTTTQRIVNIRKKFKPTHSFSTPIYFSAN